MENVYEHLLHEMSSDEECWTKKDRRLKHTYNNLSDHEKDIVDDMFITLCGWSFKTLVNQNK